MKAITVAQPWAQLIVCGVKAYDVRTWKTTHRGPLLIHAGKRLSETTRAQCAEEPLRSLLRAHGILRASDLPLGALIGTVELIDCIDTDALLAHPPEAQAPGEVRRLRSALVDDFRPGLWAWKLTKCRRFKEPIACKGVLGMFEVEMEP